MSVIGPYETITEICGGEYKVLVRYCYYPAIQGGSVSKPEPAFVEVITTSVKIGNAIVELETTLEWDTEMGEEILENR